MYGNRRDGHPQPGGFLEISQERLHVLLLTPLNEYHLCAVERDGWKRTCPKAKRLSDGRL